MVAYFCVIFHQWCRIQPFRFQEIKFPTYCGSNKYQLDIPENFISDSFHDLLYIVQNWNLNCTRAR